METLKYVQTILDFPQLKLSRSENTKHKLHIEHIILHIEQKKKKGLKPGFVFIIMKQYTKQKNVRTSTCASIIIKLINHTRKSCCQIIIMTTNSTKIDKTNGEVPDPYDHYPKTKQPPQQSGRHYRHHLTQF